MKTETNRASSNIKILKPLSLCPVFRFEKKEREEKKEEDLDCVNSAQNHCGEKFLVNYVNSFWKK